MLVLVNVFCICDGENPPGAGVVDGEVLPPPAGTKFWPASTQKWRHSTEPRCSTSGRFFLGSVAPRCRSSKGHGLAPPLESPVDAPYSELRDTRKPRFGARLDFLSRLAAAASLYFLSSFS